MPIKKTQDAPIEVIKIYQEQIIIRVIGETPLICECFSEKNKRDLLAPTGRKTAVEKATTVKHDPRREAYNSAYRLASGPTFLGFPSTGFKDALRSAALDLSGVNKTESGRLTRFIGEYNPIWGEPKMIMSMVRNSDMARTPDVRSRVIIPRWCSEVRVRFTLPKMTEMAVLNLMNAAGLTNGIGGWRQEKGSADFGLWRLVAGEEDEAEFAAIQREGGRDEQIRSMNDLDFYDMATADLMRWFDEEMTRRERRGLPFVSRNGNLSEYDDIVEVEEESEELEPVLG